MESTIDTNMPSADGLQLPSKPAEDRLIGGRYQLCGLLKQEPTVETFLATDLVAGESVVVRLFRLADIPPSVRLRLEHDSAILRTLDSPWLAHVLDHGQEAEWFFVVRSYVPGITLRQRLLRAPLELPEVLRLARCLFSALRDVHRRGVLHRDIRPTNLIVEKDSSLGVAILTDFSLGGNRDPATSTSAESIEAAWYHSPERAGTLDYDIGETADLYSAGIVLFECVTGHQPFRGDSVGVVLLQHMTSPVPELRSICPSYRGLSTR